jgi:hypothetical protein
MASSFLQLLDSPWVPSMSAFSKTNIHFPSDANNVGVFILDQPHITSDLGAGCQSHATPSQPGIPMLHSFKSFESPPTTPQPPAYKLSFTDALDNLGILLLELCFGRPLESQPSRTRWPAGATPQEKSAFDIMAARTWQCDVLYEAGADYAEAVAWCLGGNRSTPVERWRVEMLRRVVWPLQQCRDYLAYGGMPVWRAKPGGFVGFRMMNDA